MSSLAEVIIDDIYPRLYFSLPRLPARASSTRLNERGFSILLLLEMKSKEGKTLTVGEIGKIGKLSNSDTTRKIKDLEKKGFVRKSICNSDERSKEVYLTDQGIQALSIEKEYRKQWFKKFIGALEEKEKAFLHDMLRKFCINHQP